jgi:hypothetical protein
VSTPTAIGRACSTLPIHLRKSTSCLGTRVRKHLVTALVIVGGRLPFGLGLRLTTGLLLTRRSAWIFLPVEHRDCRGSPTLKLVVRRLSMPSLRSFDCELTMHIGVQECRHIHRKCETLQQLKRNQVRGNPRVQRKSRTHQT